MSRGNGQRRYPPEAHYQMELLRWLVDEDILASSPAVPEDDLHPDFRDAVQALHRVSGDGPRFVQAVELLTREGKHRAARLLDAAASEYPTMSLDSVIEAIRSAAHLRRLQEAASGLLAVEPGDNPSMTLQAAVGTLVQAALGGSTAPQGGRPASELVPEVLSRTSRRFVPSGISVLDSLYGGWMVGALHLVLGLTGSGKTSFVLQSAMAAARSGMRVYIVSGEMTGAELLPRLLGDRLVQYVDDAGTPITVERVVRGDPQALPVFEAAAAEAEQELARIIVDDRSWPTVTHVLAAVRRQHAVSQLHAVYVDYLQLVQAPAGPSRPREQQVREIAESMKQLARELGIAVVVTAQLVDPPAWASEQDQPQRTGAPAVRESRAAAHAADLVVELARPSRADSRFVPYTLRVLKARHSAADSTSEMLLYDRWSCRFERAPEGMRVEY